MKTRFLSFSLILVATSSAFSQSGRRVKETKPPPPTAAESPKETTTNTAKQETSSVTAEKNEDYKCTEDKSLVRIVESGTNEQILNAKEVDTRATINSRPKPAYTKEARRNGIQGFVILKVVLASPGKVSRVRVVRGLPFGLTENAIRAACRIDFKPAIKGSKPVSQWVTVEYAFRLADSSILGP